MYDPLGILGDTTKPSQQVDPLGILPSYKKKVGGEVSKVGGQVGISAPQLQEGDDPVKQILEPKRQEYANAAGKYNLLSQGEQFRGDVLHQRPVFLKTGEKITPQWTEFQQAKNEHDAAANDLVTTKDAIKQSYFKNGSIATKHLQNKIMSTGRIDPNNETDQLALEKKQDYDNLYKGLSSSKSIESAAINERLSTDESFRKQYDALQKEGLPLPDAVSGLTTALFMSNHGNDLEALSKEHPEIKNDYEDLKNNLLTKHPEYGIAYVANKISQAREKLGYNNIVANFDTKTFDKHNDQIAKSLSPEEQKIWNEHKDEVTDKIDTGGMLNRFEEGIEGGLSNTKNLFKRITFQNTKGERISNEMVKEATSVNNGEKGWKKSLGTASGFVGTIANMAALGNVASGFGASEIASNAVSNTPFVEDFMRQGEMKYPDNPAKALTSGAVNSIAFMALSPLKGLKVGEVLSGVKPELEAAIKDLPENATANTLRERLSNAFQKGMLAYGTTTSEMGGLTLFNQGLDKWLGLNKQTYEKYHPENELGDVVKQMAIGAIVPSVVIGAGEAIGKPKIEQKLELGKGEVAPMKLGEADISEHGEDTKTAQGIENGIKPSKLTEEGLKQAKDLGQYLVDNNQNEIVTSGVERASQTGKEAADEANKILGIHEGTPMYEANGVKVKSNPLLNTANIGSDESKPAGTFDEKGWSEGTYLPKGAETFKSFTDRMEKAYDYVKSLPETTHVVAHSKVMRALNALEKTDGKWTPETTKEFLKEEAQPTEQPTDFDTFKNHILDVVANTPDNSFDFRITTGLDQKGIEQAVRNIKEGKDTKAAQTLLSAIKEMHDDGYVYMNTAAGGKSEAIQIPIKEYMAEVNKPLKIEDLDELNTLLGEDAFNSNFDNAFNYETERSRTGEETPATYAGTAADGTPKTPSVESAPSHTQQVQQGEPYDKLVKEHEELIPILEHGTTEERKKLADEQRQELEEYRQKAGQQAPPPTAVKLPTEETKPSEVTGVKKAVTEPLRQDRGLPKVELPKFGSDIANLQSAKERVDSGTANPVDMVNEIISQKRGYRNEDEVWDMQYYAHQLKAKGDELVSELNDANTPEEEVVARGKILQLSDEVDRQTEAAQIAGNQWHKVGMGMQPVIDDGFNPSREKLFIKEAYGGEIPEDVKLKLDVLTKERDDAIAQRDKIQEQLNRRMAKAGMEEIRKVASRAKRKQVKEELLKEEQDLLSELKKAIKKDLGNLHAGIPLPKETLETLGKLAVNYFKQGYVKLEDLVDKMYDQLKDDVNITRKDVRDFISEYRPTVEALETQKLKTKAEKIETQIIPTILKTRKGKLQGVSEEPSFAPSTKRQLVFRNNNDWVKANQRVYNAEAKIRTLKRQAFESQKNFYQRGLMWAGRLIRLSVLSGTNVLWKLASAATIGGALKRIPEQVIGGIYSKVFSGVAEKAPIEGSLNAKSELRFYKEFFNPIKFIKNSWEILKSGESKLTKKFSTGKYEHIPGLYLPTDLHQIIKDPLKRGTYEASFRNGLINAEKSGLDINDPLVINSIETAAYKRANYEIFQEQNWLSRKFQAYKNKMEKSGNIGATGKFVADFLIPVSTVPTNIVRRLATTSPFGLVRGAIKLGEAYRNGIENLTPYQADAVMRQLKQGTLGTALWLVGWFGYSHFGGLFSKYDPNKKRKEGELASDEMEVNGKMIPKPAQHALPLEIIQLAATSRHIYENYKSKGESTPNSVLNAGMGAIGAMGEQIPIVETGVKGVEAMQDPYQGEKFKEDIKRRFEPQILRETGIIPTGKKKMGGGESGGGGASSKFKKSTKPHKQYKK